MAEQQPKQKKQKKKMKEKPQFKYVRKNLEAGQDAVQLLCEIFQSENENEKKELIRSIYLQNDKNFDKTLEQCKEIFPVKESQKF